MNAFPMNDPRYARIVANIQKRLTTERQREFELLVANLAVLAEDVRRERDRADGDLLLPLPTLNDLKGEVDDEEHPDVESDQGDDSNDAQPDGRAVKTLKRVPPDTPPVNDAYVPRGKASQFVISSARNTRTRHTLQGDDPLSLTGEE